MKELSPYLHSVLFKKQIKTVDEYQRVFSKWGIDGQQSQEPIQDPIHTPVQEPAPKLEPEPIQELAPKPKATTMTTSQKFLPKILLVYFDLFYSNNQNNLAITFVYHGCIHPND